MKLNENVVIVGRKVLLVPYEIYHVPKYHEWMKSEELQELTASEPLSLEEEYAMQKTWRQDANKCTFVVVEKESFLQTGQDNQEEAEIQSMVGDVNLFLQDDSQTQAEVEIMIAEGSARGKGLGKEAVCSMMRYGVEQLGVKKYSAKIGLQNAPSIRLFSQLGFTETSRSEVFQEITLETDITEQFTLLLQSHTPHYDLKSHSPLPHLSS